MLSTTHSFSIRQKNRKKKFICLKFYSQRMPYLWVRPKKMKTSVNLARIWIHWSTISAPSWWRSKTRSAIQICWVRTSLRWPLWVSSTRFRVKWAHCPLKPGVMAVTRSDLVVHCPTQRRACMGSKWNSILSFEITL